MGARTCHSVRTALAGMRRVDFVRMVEAERSHFFVVGVGHRVPVEREISPAVALELSETLPVRFEHVRQVGDVHYLAQQIRD